jgi:hypothetical protein
MSRIRALTREEAAIEVRPLFDRDLETHGQVLNTTAIRAHCPPIHLATKALGDGVKASGLIPARLQSLLNIRVASLVGCPF